MIKGTVIKVRDEINRPETNYRSIDALNCSMIKLFDTEPIKFYEQFKLGKKKKDSKGTALIIGDIVDFYILDCKGHEQEFEDRFDEKFALFQETKGTGQVFILCDTLLEVTLENTNENGEIMKEFDDLFKEAARRVKILGKYSGKTDDKILEDFKKSGQVYYQTLIDNVGKVVVDVSLLDKARLVAQLLMKDPFTKDVFSDDGEIEYFPKFPIEWIYTCKNGSKIVCKSELDLLKIDHDKKIIYPKDLKTTYDNENFEMNYLKHRYDLQAAFYHLAVRYWASQEGLKGYIIEPMEFIVGDTSASNRRPIRYQITEEDLFKATHGFSVYGKQYKGIITLIEEINWAEITNNWNASKEVIDSNGKMILNIKYDDNKPIETSS